MTVTNEMRRAIWNYLEMDLNNEEDLTKLPDSFYLFYHRCMEARMDYADADRYAILNTLFNYDIGMENARSIDHWMYENDNDIFELDAREKDKRLLRQAAKELGIGLDFSNFATEEYTAYKFFD